MSADNDIDGRAAADIARRPRVWPAIVLVAFFWVFRLVARQLDMTMMMRFFSLMIAFFAVTLCFLVWWFVSRRTLWSERIVGFVGAIVISIAAAMACNRSIRGLWIVVVPPILLTAWALWWAIARGQSPRVRTGGLLIVFALTCGFFTLLRSAGLSGEQQVSYHLRWTPTREQAYVLKPLTSTGAENVLAVNAPPIVLRSDDWPAFRGPRRDGTVLGLSIATDWKAHLPKQLWRQPVGPGWSSLIVVGGRVFTHEQRGSSEILVSRDATTGAIVWVHSDPVRFEESMSGPGPRATPTFADGKIYSLGATGVLDCLDAASGKLYWTRNLTADGASKPFTWGFASSPLVTHDLVIVYGGGAKGLLAYRVEDGQPAWFVNSGLQGYASAQPAILRGHEQILFLSDAGLIAVDPLSGRELWSHDVTMPNAPRTIQPHVISDSQVLISSEMDLGTALIDVQENNGAWRTQRTWTSRAFKPSFNDFVVKDGYAYGFDEAIFCCVDLKTGKRAWREGEYGHGQVLLLADQGLLLISTEDGAAVLLKASPSSNQELGRFQALSAKTWNHPALAGNRLYLRNGEEMTCFELAR